MWAIHASQHFRVPASHRPWVRMTPACLQLAPASVHDWLAVLRHRLHLASQACGKVWLRCRTVQPACVPHLSWRRSASSFCLSGSEQRGVAGWDAGLYAASSSSCTRQLELQGHQGAGNCLRAQTCIHTSLRPVGRAALQQNGTSRNVRVLLPSSVALTAPGCAGPAGPHTSPSTLPQCPAHAAPHETSMPL